MVSASGTYSFSLTVLGVVEEAWERCQFRIDALEGWQIRRARQTLQLQMLQWSTRGINLWAIEQVGPLSMALGLQSLQTLPGTADVLEVTVTRSGVEFILSPMARDQYVAISNKTLVSRPTQYWVEKTLPWPTLVFYPLEDLGTDTLIYWRLRQLQDVSASAQGIDIPPLFYEAICGGLASRIADKWVTPKSHPEIWRDLRTDLRASAKASYGEAFMNDRERPPFVIQPNLDGMW